MRRARVGAIGAALLVVALAKGCSSKKPNCADCVTDSDCSSGYCVADDHVCADETSMTTCRTPYGPGSASERFYYGRPAPTPDASTEDASKPDTRAQDSKDALVEKAPPLPPGWHCVSRQAGTELATCDCTYETAAEVPHTCPGNPGPLCCYTIGAVAKECWCEVLEDELCPDLVAADDGKRVPTCPPP